MSESTLSTGTQTWIDYARTCVHDKKDFKQREKEKEHEKILTLKFEQGEIHSYFEVIQKTTRSIATHTRKPYYMDGIQRMFYDSIEGFNQACLFFCKLAFDFYTDFPNEFPYLEIQATGASMLSDYKVGYQCLTLNHFVRSPKTAGCMTHRFRQPAVILYDLQYFVATTFTKYIPDITHESAYWDKYKSSPPLPKTIAILSERLENQLEQFEQFKQFVLYNPESGTETIKAVKRYYETANIQDSNNKKNKQYPLIKKFGIK